MIRCKVRLVAFDEIIQTRRRPLPTCEEEVACCTGDQVCRVPGRDLRDAWEGSDRECGAQSHRYSSPVYKRDFHHHGRRACAQTRSEESAAEAKNREYVDGGGRSYIHGCS